MILNKINAEITQENEDQVQQHIGGIRTNLDFLVGLPAEDKKRLTKLSFRYVEFTNLVRIYAEKFPGHLPNAVTLEMFQRDLDLRESLKRVSSELKALDRDIDDTMMLLESEIYQTSRLFYKGVKASAQEGDKDAERMAKELSNNYRKKRFNTDEPVNPAEPAQPAVSPGQTV